ncbi:restriction endonuclease subunit S [Nostoc sp.]|uniref:restriction endonuclease subunit S n=1 Tax=Nostoc sp. TaxID=1180 RepID=UPI002FF72143
MIQKLKSNYVTWEEEKIGKICQLINGRAFKPTEWSNTGLKIVRIQNLNNETKPFNYYAQPIDARFIINNGEVLISWSGTPGTSFGAHLWNRGEAVLNQHIFRVVLDESKCLKKFFIYAINWRIEELICKAHGGVGLRHITKKELENVTIPIPFKNDSKRSLDIQSRIVARIEALLTEVNDSRCLLNAMCKEANQIMDIVLEQVYGELEKSQFAVIPLGSLLSKKPQYGTSEKASENPEGTAILRMGNIKRTGKISFENLKYIQLGSHEQEKYILEKGDILFNRTNSADLVGKSAVFESDMIAIFASYLIRLTPDQTRIKSKYLNYYINSTQGRAYIQSQLTRAIGQVNVNAQKLVAMPVPLPDTQMQERIIAYFDTIQAEVEEILRFLEQDAKLLDMLEQSILERAFRGEL